MKKEPLFILQEGTQVFKGDILYHPDKYKVGWYCIAEFSPDGECVTVRSPGGAVPTVRISDLHRSPPDEKISTLKIYRGEK